MTSIGKEVTSKCKLCNLKLDNGCESVGWTVASELSGLQFESSHC